MTDHHDYFGEVGVWRKGASHVGRSYVVGFVLSIVLTFAAYGAVVNHVLPRELLVPVVLILACLQFLVQIHNFLHVDGGPASRDRLLALVYSSVLVLALVLGTMWIMENLRDRTMPDTGHMEQYMHRQQGI